MKSIDQLLKLSKNPFYKLTPAEEQALADAGLLDEDEDSKKKLSSLNFGSATVKETGKLEKHPSDPVVSE